MKRCSGLQVVLALPLVLAVGCRTGGGPAVSVPAPPRASPGVELGTLSGKMVARYGSDTYTADDFVADLVRIPERNRVRMTPDSRRDFVVNRVVSELVVRDAQAKGLASDPEIEHQVAELRRRLVVQKMLRDLQEMPVVDDDTVRRFWAEHPERFSATTIHARHVLLPSEDAAKAIRDQLRADPAAFPRVAQEKSTDMASARQGGDLGWFGRGRMVPEFEEVAFALEPGKVSDPVKSPYGWHVILVEEVKRGEPDPFDQVKEQIRIMLRNQAVQSRVDGYYGQLKEAARFAIDEQAIEEVGRAVAAASPPPPPEGLHGSMAVGGAGAPGGSTGAGGSAGSGAPH
ncbi:MAG: peptidylprolyl isomerase [Alphaproteobacteria bacterium]